MKIAGIDLSESLKALLTDLSEDEEFYLVDISDSSQEAEKLDFVVGPESLTTNFKLTDERGVAVGFITGRAKKEANWDIN